jgi:hypothetical protein
MAVKKIIHNAFEQILESGRDVAKSSAKQVVETISPWDMIRNSFEGVDANKNATDPTTQMKELQGKSDKHTPLNFDNLQKSYADQDKQKMEAMKQRLFQIVRRDDEKSSMKSKQQKNEKEHAVVQEESDKRRREEEKRRQQSMSAPQGKLKGRRKKPSEPQPAETKPGSSKQ